MKLIIKGMELDKEMLASKIDEVALSTIERVQEETGATIENYSIHEAEITLKFMVEGMDEPQVLTVEHYEGQKEMLTWIVDSESTVTNEDESMFDEYTASQARGEELIFKEIESVYDDSNLILEESEEFSDMAKVIYAVKGEDYKVVRIYQEQKLIQEYRLNPKEETEIA